MIPCFGDTSYFLALLIPGDENYVAARNVAVTLGRPIVTSEFVVVEVGNFLSGLAARKRFATFIRALREDPQTTIVPASSELVTAGIGLYVGREDKSWSLTDCISFEIMRQRGITEALTADRHFEQAGFTGLLKPGA